MLKIHLFLWSTLQVAYKKGSKEGQAQYSLPLDMINLSHAKKSQALASDLEYRTRLHDYTVMPDDIKIAQAKKAYSLQSEVRNRRLFKRWMLNKDISHG